LVSGQDTDPFNGCGRPGITGVDSFMARGHLRVALNWSALVYYKLPLIFEPQPEGGYTVTSPLLPELLTEGDTVADALDNVRDALAAVLEIYQEQGRSLPLSLTQASPTDAVRVEMVVAVP
jgi:antitoxin HicB